MREIKDEAGRSWQVLALPNRGAHFREGAKLAFAPAGEEGAEPLHTDVVFNSVEAADFAIRTMADKELLRRLNWARQEAGMV